MDTRERIIQAACDTVAREGVGELTVTLVARRARVSSALVHYHFATKQRLLLAAARALSERRTDARIAALASGSGLAALDLMWAAVASGPGAAAERAWPDLVLVARSDPAVRSALAAERERERKRAVAPLARLLESLGSRPRLPVEDLATALGTFLDGVSSALASGAPADDVRASYDAFWLALVAVGQPPPAR